MEPLAYLHLVQDYESDETKELIRLQRLSSSIAQINFKSFGKTTVGLLSAASTTWILGSPYTALAEGYSSKDYVFEDYISQDYVSQEHNPKEKVPIVFVEEKYVKTYAGGGYYYILQESDFEDRPAHAVPESSYSTSSSSIYHPVRPAPALLCGVFKLGDSGSGVSCLQELLQKAGYFDGAITGYFGTKTCDAVIALQHDYGLSVDGVAGPQTLEILNQIAAHQPY